MMTCLPQSLCSWNFQVLGASAGPAVLTFNFLSEQGSISLGGSELSVVKHGWLSGHWTLERGSDTFADAKKPSAMFRAFEIQSRGTPLTVKAQTAFTRCYDIISGGSPIGVIRPAHPFTRRAFIECDPSVPETTQLFAFWLVALTWRRAARNNNNSSANANT